MLYFFFISQLLIMKEVLLTIVLLMIVMFIYRAFNYRKTMKCIRLLNKFTKQIIVIALIFVIVFRPQLLNHLIDLTNRLNLTLDTRLYSRTDRKSNRTHPQGSCRCPS